MSHTDVDGDALVQPHEALSFGDRVQADDGHQGVIVGWGDEGYALVTFQLTDGMTEIRHPDREMHASKPQTV